MEISKQISTNLVKVPVEDIILLGNTNKYLSGSIKILIDLFDKILVLTCTYICEVWGVSLFIKRFSL